MKLYGLKIQLEPDTKIPTFLRLRFSRVEVPLADVLQRGIHPVSAMGLSGDWCQAAELLARCLNRGDRRFPELSPQRLNYDIMAVRDNPLYDKRPALERTLEHVARDVYFADHVNFDGAVKQAKAFLIRR